MANQGSGDMCQGIAASAPALRVPAQIPKSPGSSGRIPSLDGLRAISIAMVIAFHTVNAVWRRTRPGRDYDGPWRWFLNGGLGVSVFFVISGFLITNLLIAEVRKTGSIHLLDFYVRRTFRIWPAFYVYLAVVAMLHAFHVVGINGKRDLVAAALFVFNYVPRAGSTWVGHTWSLAVEEQFYLFWPALLLLIGLRRGRFAAFLLVLLVPFIRFFEVQYLLPSSMFLTRMWEMAHTRIDTIMVGCLIALFWDSGRFKNALRWMFTCKLHWAALVMLYANEPLLGRIAPPSISLALGYSIEAGCIGLLLIWAVEHSKSAIGRLLNSRLLVHLGGISYSLYLWNAMFCTPLNKTWTGQFPANILCSIALAEISRYAVEIPFLNLRVRFFARRPVPHAIAPPPSVADSSGALLTEPNSVS